MSSVLSGELSTENLKDGSKVLILSHDLDTYTMMSLSLRRDFQIKTISSWFLENVDKAGKEFAGLHFCEFLGRKVDGFYCSVEAVILSGMLDFSSPEKIKGMVVLQMVPDFEIYKSMCQVLGKLYNKQEVIAKSFYPSEQIAQELSEFFLLNVLGLCVAMPQLRNNPLPPVANGQIQDKMRTSRLVNDPRAIWNFFKDLSINYATCKSGDNFFGLGMGRKHLFVGND